MECSLQKPKVKKKKSTRSERIVVDVPVSKDSVVEEECNQVKPDEIHKEESLQSGSPVKHKNETIANDAFPSIEPCVVSYPKILNSEPRTSVNIKEFQSLYPDLKSIHLSEQIHKIVCGQTLVTTYIHQCQAQTAVLANTAYQEFVQEVHDIAQHPLWEIVHEYQKAKRSTNQLKKDIKYLDSNFKRKKDYLWKSVKKEVHLKGKCDDGNNVSVSHSYVIKELDQMEYDELIKTSHGIVEDISKNAFQTYVENLARRRIESFMSDLVKETVQDVSNGEGISSSSSTNLKKSISIFFHYLRQNPPDKGFFESSKEWLSHLVSVLLNFGGLSDKLFLFNHVLRSPKGIHTWATKFIQMTVDECESVLHIDCDCSQNFLLLLFMLFNPIPFREAFLSNLNESESVDGNFAIIDSEGEEEELFELYQKWSDADVLSLMNQIPIRKLFHCWFSDLSEKSELLSENKMLKVVAYSTAVSDVLFTGISNSSEYLNLVNHLSQLIRDILLCVSKFWVYENMFTSEFKIILQAVYDKFFFHIMYEFIRLKVWNILPSLPFDFISDKMLWNVIWIFSCSKPEDYIFSEKDLERKMKENSSLALLTCELKKEPSKNVVFVLETLKKLCVSTKSSDDFSEFIIKVILELAFLDQTSRQNLAKEGCAILSSMICSKPSLISLLLKEIDRNQSCAFHIIPVFQNSGLLVWSPGDDDISYLSSWLLSNSLCEGQNCLARIILSQINWNFSEDGSFCVPLHLHQRIALLIAEAYIKFDQSANEWFMSRGIKQMLQFTNIGGMQINEEGFVYWAWNLLFSLRLHPLDQKHPPWISIFDGSIDSSETNNFNAYSGLLLADQEKKHPCISYLKIVMTDTGLNSNNLLKVGLNCLTSLVESQQYMACIRALYYVLPFFVKNSDALLNDDRFLQFITELLCADLGILSNITYAPVIGTVLLNVASMIKHQINEAAKCTVECTVPLLKLWIKLFMKILLNGKLARNYPTKQAVFLLDILVKLSYVHPYSRDCILDLFHSINTFSCASANNEYFWKRIFSSASSFSPVLDEKTVSDYPLLAFFITSSEMKRKNVNDVWARVQIEMIKRKNSTVSECLKKVCDEFKIELLPLDILPIYRWAHQIIALPPSHSACLLFWHQFFISFFQRVQIPSFSTPSSLGLKFFSSKPYSKLLEQMKNQLKLSKQHFQDSLRLQTALHQNKKHANHGEVNLSENALRLLNAFELWINEESFHEGNICLSALEPKYCPDQLSSILGGDQNPWFDLLPSASVNNELEQKVKSWNETKYFGNEMKTTESIVSQELLPEQFESEIDHNPSLQDNKFLFNEFHAVNENIMSSSKMFLQLIEKNHSVIFEKARFFDEQMKKLKQLNSDFISLVPQEYSNENLELIKNKVCHKGEGCSGSSRFVLKIQKYVKHERISLKIDYNRKDFVIIQDQLTNLPVNDLCDASILIENYIKALSLKMRSAKDDEAYKLKKLGATLFYNQLDATENISPLVSEYPPTRLFFSSIIDSLGKEFILGFDLELQDLIKATLNHSQAGCLALNLFDPNKASIVSFVQAYEALASAVGKYSPSMLLALLSKVDLSLWMQNSCPPLEVRQRIFNSIGSALFSCGYSPPSELFSVFEVLKRHFRVVLKYMFPDLFYDALSFLLKGLTNQKLSKDLFYETYSCFGCPLFNSSSSIEDIEVGLRNFSLNQRLSASQQVFLSTSQLNIMQMSYASKSVYHYFTQTCDSSTLYAKYESYVKEIAILLGIVSHSLVALQLDDALTEKQLSSAWEMFHLPFVPFLHPIYVNNAIYFPWSDKEVDEARYMFQSFIVCFKFFHQQLVHYNVQGSVFSCLWKHYIQTYIEPGYRHYSVFLYHEEILKLPWHQFYPSTDDIEGMCKILQSTMEESKYYLSKICLQIPWLHVMKSISAEKNPEYVAEVLATLGKLLILSQLDASEVEKRGEGKSLKDYECLNWYLLTVEDVEELLVLYYEKGEPFMSKTQSSSKQSANIAWFLKLLCCMEPNVNYREEYSNFKRVLYLEKFFSALKDHLLQDNVKASVEICPIFPRILSDIDRVMCSVPSEFQISSAVPLLQETLKFVNNLPDKELGLQVLKMSISWLNSNAQSPLLLPYLKASFSSHSISHTVLLCECCIAGRFSNEVLGSCDARKVWHLIYSFFDLPSRLYDEFSRVCLNKNAFLTLYCHIKHSVMPQCSQIKQKCDLLSDMIQWVRRTNLSISDEAKILLLLDLILELSSALTLHGEQEIVQQELVALCDVLETLSEDGSGFFSMIGLGTVSNLSVSFRFLCRVMEAFIFNKFFGNSSVQSGDSSNMPTYYQENTSRDKMNSSAPATKALDNLTSLKKKKLYAALYSQIDHAVKCISDSKYTFSDSREILRYFSAILYPKDSFLSSLNC